MIQDTRVSEAQPYTRRMPGMGASVEEVPAAILRLSWGALIAGAVVAIATQAFLAVLGLAIGLSLAPITGEGIAIGAGIWWALTAIVALFAGGYVAGRFSYIRHPFHSSMHGIMCWCLVTVLSLFFVGFMGSVVAAGPLGAVVEDMVPVQQAQTGSANTAASGQFNQTQTGVVHDADTSRGAGAAWWTFFALLLGVAAAGLGGYLAAPQNIRESNGMSRTFRSSDGAEV